jgi:dTDP-glucose 4,6-dehydratase
MIFVTGGCGFIGSNFVHFLKEKTEEPIVVLDKFTYASSLNNLNPLEVEVVKVDLADKSSLSEVFSTYKPSKIFHFAAESHVDSSIEDVMPFVDSNVIGSINLLKLSCDYNIELFHHISTDEVYGSLQYDEKSFTEKTPYNPLNPYSASKAASDHFVMSFHNTYGLPVKITNCSNNYGPRQHKEKLIPKTILNAIRGDKIPVYGNGENIRDWIYVEDHCRAVYEVFMNGKVGEKYNIGGESEFKNIDIVKNILNILNRDYDLIEYVQDRPGHDLRYSINNAKIKRELNWSPKYSLQEGLEKTIKWYYEFYSS